MGFSFLRKWSEFTACGFISDHEITCFSVVAFVFIEMSKQRGQQAHGQHLTQDGLCCGAEQVKQRNSNFFFRGRAQRKGSHGAPRQRCLGHWRFSHSSSDTCSLPPASHKLSPSLRLHHQPGASPLQSPMLKGSYPSLQSRLWFSEHTGTGSCLGRLPLKGLLRPSLCKQLPLFP